MKNNIKMISCALAGIMVGGISVVCANQAIQAMQNTEIKVSLNGQVQEFKDETTGERQYPITYNNRTYLPLRNVASLSGLNVDYDNKTNTAVLSSDGYSDEQLIQLSRLYYTLNSSSHYNPQQVVIDSKNGDIVTIHLYDDMGDHLATSDWYTINRKTGKGTNVLEQDIDLSEEGLLKLIASNGNGVILDSDGYSINYNNGKIEFVSNNGKREYNIKGVEGTIIELYSWGSGKDTTIPACISNESSPSNVDYIYLINSDGVVFETEFGDGDYDGNEIVFRKIDIPEKVKSIYRLNGYSDIYVVFVAEKKEYVYIRDKVTFYYTLHEFNDELKKELSDNAKKIEDFIYPE